MSESTAYNPKLVEPDIYRRWEASGYFNPDKLSGKRNKSFSVSMPPPNVTGELHIGHALTIALEDLMVRFHRMAGDAAVWIPGTDHAGISTQIKVERSLAENGISRHEIGRQAFLKHVWAWKEKYGDTITKQIRAMGASCDWSRERFTMDPGLTAAVHEAFIRLFNEGLIYRSTRIINWCPNDGTALSDLEVIHEERAGSLWYISYRVKDSSHTVTVATTRPETLLGDTAIAVNPSDERFKVLVGRSVVVPLINRVVPIVADRRVDPAFGTGAVKVTPAHDFLDAEIAKAHGLPSIQVIGPTAQMTAEAGNDFEGLPVHEARLLVVEALNREGLLEKTEDYRYAASVCERCGTTIEPQISQQWFINMKPLATKAIAAVRSGKIRILPKRFEKQYFHWMENIQDWCISRQLWWGHRIPVWYRSPKRTRQWEMKIYGRDIFDAIGNNSKKIEIRAGRPRGDGKYWGDFKPGDRITFRLADESGDTIVSNVASVDRFVSKVTRFRNFRQLFAVYRPSDDYPGKTVQQLEQWWRSRPALWQRVQRYGVWAIQLTTDAREVVVGSKPPAGEGWAQDDDVLDTWFSSALWTFSTLGWPKNQKGKIKRGDLKRFHPTSVMETGWDILTFWVSRMVTMSLYLTGEIPFQTVYLNGLILDKNGKKMSKSKGTGVDPLMMTEKYGTDALRLSVTIGQSAGQDFRMYEEKVAGQRNFVNKLWNIGQYVLRTNNTMKFVERPKAKTLADRWILSRLAYVNKEATAAIERFDFSAAGQLLEDFAWHDFADWYLEVHKVEHNDQVLLSTFLATLKLLHPFAPFVTEELWRPWSPKRLLMVEVWPKPGARNRVAERSFADLQRTVVALRNFNKYSGLAAGESGTIRANKTGAAQALLERLSGVRLNGREHGERIALGALWAEFPSVRVKAFQAWRDQERENIEGYAKRLGERLKNPRLPKNIKQQIESRLSDAEKQLAEL